MSKVLNRILIIMVIASGIALLYMNSTMNTTVEQLKEELASKDGELSEVNQEINELQTEIDRYKEILNGLDIILYNSKSCSDAKLIDNPNAKKPTYDELLSFLIQDKTEYNEYKEDVYDCSEFSRDFHNNAESYGIKCGVVHIYFSNQYFLAGHALNAVLTTDYGLVFVDVTTSPDAIAFVKSGEIYKSVSVGNISKYHINNETWWKNLTKNYYSITSPFTILGKDGKLYQDEGIVDDIEIYW